MMMTYDTIQDMLNKLHDSDSNTIKNNQQKQMEKVERAKKEAEEKLFLEAVIWPEPLSAECTDESLKIRQDFEFSDKGIDDAVKWLEEQYEADKARWNGSINDWDI